MAQRIRTAVIGAGRLGRFHAQKLAASENAELVAVVDPVAANRERVAAECKCRPLADHAGLVGDIDAAIIAAPTKWHYHLARDLVEGDIHVLVEKPLCASLAEADALVDAARRCGVVLQVGHVERFNPAFCAMAEHAVEPKYIESLRASPFAFRSTDVGVVLDLMIHDLDLVLALAGSPVSRVDALGISVVGRHEDAANARIEFENGCVAVVSASRVSHATTRQMQVWTGQSYAAIDFAARSLRTIRPSDTLLRGEFDLDGLTPDEVAYWQEHFATEHLPNSTQSFDAVDALALECEDFLAAISTGRAPRVPGEAGRDALAAAGQVLAAISAHAWDGTPDGRTGPRLEPGRGVIPSPHFSIIPATAPPRKAAG